MLHRLLLTGQSSLCYSHRSCISAAWCRVTIEGRPVGRGRKFMLLVQGAAGASTACLVPLQQLVLIQ